MNTTLRAQRGILIYIDRIVPRDDGAMYCVREANAQKLI